jgi:hypothetical protein
MHNKLKDTIINECVGLLKREDVKDELKKLFSPIVDILIIQIYPYIYLCLIFVIISFLLHLGIFFLLLKGSKISLKLDS